MESEEEDYLYEPAASVEELRGVYRGYRGQEQADRRDDKDASVSKREIVQRIVEGDWRRGLSLDQVAMVDLRVLEERDGAGMRWSALKVVPLGSQQEDQQSMEEDGIDAARPSKRRRKDDSHSDECCVPQIRPATFLQALKSEISPLVKAHYHLHRLSKPYDLTVLRVFVTGMVLQSQGSKRPILGPQAVDGSRSLYIALQEGSPYVYVAVSGISSSTRSIDGAHSRSLTVLSKPQIASMKRIILEAIPKALSRPQHRFALKSTDLTVKSLRAVVTMRGGVGKDTGRVENSAGCFGGFANAEIEGTPLDGQLWFGKRRESIGDDAEKDTVYDERASESTKENERRIAEVKARFGPGIKHTAIDRFSIQIRNLDDTTTARSRKRRRGESSREAVHDQQNRLPVSLNFAGADVFEGLRKLAELGEKYVKLKRMPAWITGERAVSSLVI